jgi:PAS domain S-box-containing protein
MFSRLFSGWSATARIAMGQASILLTILLTASWLDVIPNRNDAILEGRAAVAEVAALNSSILITRSDLRRMEASLRLLVERHEEIHSAAVVKANGALVAVIGVQALRQVNTETADVPGLISVPLWAGNQEWGHVELQFEPLFPPGWTWFLYHPLVQMVAFITVLSFLFFYFYLGRMLKMLDPSAAIPDRVRSALDTMAEGLLVLDPKQNIMLANSAFAEIVGEPAEKLLGRRISDFAWDYPEEGPYDGKSTPWGQALESSTPHIGSMVHMRSPLGKEITFMTNSSPIMAGPTATSGVLVSFDDVSELKEIEAELRDSKEARVAATRGSTWRQSPAAVLTC